VRQWLEARRLKRWLKGLPPNAHILDVGCGDGFHLKLLREHFTGCVLEGLDADERAVNAAQQSSLQVQRGRIEDNTLPSERYDFVLMIMTIEHVADPVATLAAIRRTMKPNAKLVVITDNTRTLPFRLFQGRYWGGYHFPRHWNLFDRVSLRRTAERAGFEVEEISTELNPVNWVYSIHNVLADFGAPRWLRERFTLKSVVALTVFTLIDGVLNLSGRGSNLRAVLRKPDHSATT
jgi:SAM-dependent methyltransferase